MGLTPEQEQRAARLRDHVLQTWAPPRLADDNPVSASQTAAMLTLAYIMGREFFPKLTRRQEITLEQGLEVMRRELP